MHQRTKGLLLFQSPVAKFWIIAFLSLSFLRCGLPLSPACVALTSIKSVFLAPDFAHVIHHFFTISNILVFTMFRLLPPLRSRISLNYNKRQCPFYILIFNFKQRPLQTTNSTVFRDHQWDYTLKHFKCRLLCSQIV